MATSLKQMIANQESKVLRQGQRFERFDQIRQRHFWSTYLFAVGGGNAIASGRYPLFTTVPGAIGQGYSVPLTTRETNVANGGRIADNQNIAIQEIGVTIMRPPAVSTDADNGSGTASNVPSGSIYGSLASGIKSAINPQRPTHTDDAANVLYGMVLGMTYLTNFVPLGYCADFSQSAGVYAQEQRVRVRDELTTEDALPNMGDPSNGVPAAAFRRKLGIPILLQHGETAGMALDVPRAITLLTTAQGGAGWLEIRVDWWAIESFVEKS